jgi:hypothetical protein
MTTNNDPEISFVLPCLNEAETLAGCIDAAQRGAAACGATAEILIADNGSTDGSQDIATANGARSIPVPERGYGAALQGGFAEAKGEFIVMGDADGSYDFGEIPKYLAALRNGAEFVIGTRFRRAGGNVMPGAMPALHYWLGTPVLTWISRIFFGTRITDINCGMRAFCRDALERMDLRMTGMELASEMVIKAALLKLVVAEVPITLHPDGRSRAPHLRTWHDGWRHLRMMLLFSPRWLFAAPGIGLLAAGGAGLVALAQGPVTIGEVTFDITTMLIAALVLVLGSQLILMGIFAKSFVVAEGLLPRSRLDRVGGALQVETGVVTGLALMLAGAGLIGWAVLQWQDTGFGVLDTLGPTRAVVFGVTLFVLGVQIASAGFFLGVLRLGRRPGTGSPN